jgi:hypothetical protein
MCPFKIKRAVKEMSRRSSQNRNAPLTFYDLGLDLLAQRVISSFNAEASLGMVNRTMRHLDAIRHIPNVHRGPYRGSYIVDEHTVPLIIKEIESANVSASNKTVAIHLIVPRFSAIVCEKMEPLYAAIRTASEARSTGGGVRSLHIALLPEDISPYEYLPHRMNTLLLTFRRLPFLVEMKLDLSALSPPACPTKFGIAGCVALADLHECAPALQTVSLELVGNYIGSWGCHHLVAALLRLTKLKQLYLGLRDNALDGHSGYYLRDLRMHRTLEGLHIDLENNRIGEAGADWLSELRQGWMLNTLRLVCKNNPIGAHGRSYLHGEHGFVDSPRLRDIHIQT